MTDFGISASRAATGGVSLRLAEKRNVHSGNDDFGVDVSPLTRISINEKAIDHTLMAICGVLENSKVFKTFLEIIAGLVVLVEKERLRADVPLPKPGDGSWGHICQRTLGRGSPRRRLLFRCRFPALLDPCLVL